MTQKEKTAFRQELLERRRQLSPIRRQEDSRRILAQLRQSPVYRQAKRLFLYLSMGEEVETDEIFLTAWQDGKETAVPKTTAEGEMFFCLISSLEEVTVGRFGIREPMSGREQAVLPQRGELFLVPMVGFDEKNNRMGYGGGYYDRYFANYPELRRVGLAFSAQAVPSLPVETTDVPMTDILTELGWMGGRIHE